MKGKQLAIVFVSCALSATTQAQLFESFDYPDGPLTVVSNSAWELWGPDSLDANVVGGAIVDIPNPPNTNPFVVTDVIRPFDGVLTQLGQFASFGFDLNMQNGDNDGGGFAISPATSPYHLGGQSYRQSLFLGFEHRPLTNKVSIFGWFTNDQQNQVYVQLGDFPLSQWHHVSGTLFRRTTGGYVDSSLSVNGGSPASASYLMNDARGFNAIEFWSYARGPVPSLTFDNIHVQSVPEPATIALIGMGVALFIKRKSRR